MNNVTAAQRRMLDDAIWNLVELDRDGRVINGRDLRLAIMERYEIGKVRAVSAIARVARAKREKVRNG